MRMGRPVFQSHTATSRPAQPIRAHQSQRHNTHNLLLLLFLLFVRAGGDGCSQAAMGVARLLCTPADPSQQVQTCSSICALGMPSREARV